MSRFVDAGSTERPELEPPARYPQTRVTGATSTFGSNTLTTQCNSRHRSLSALSVGSSIVSSAPSGSGSEAAQSSPDEHRPSLSDFFLGDGGGFTYSDDSGDDDESPTDEVGQEANASTAVDEQEVSVESRRTLFRRNLFWHSLLGCYFIYTNTSILPLGTRLHVATANVAVVTLGPELLWLVRTAHRARTFGLLHLAVRLHTTLNCRKLAATLFVVATVSYRLGGRSPAISSPRYPSDRPPTLPNLSAISNTTSTFLAPVHPAISLVTHTLSILFIIITSISAAALFCITCALYPIIYHPTTLLSISLIALLLGLKADLLGQRLRRDSLICFSDRHIILNASQHTRPPHSLATVMAVDSPHCDDNTTPWASFLISFVVRVFVHVISPILFALSATSWLLLLGELDPERVLIWILGRLYSHRCC